MTKRGNPRKPSRKPTGSRTMPAGPLPIQDAPALDPIDAGMRSMLAATRRRCGTCRNFQATIGKLTGECRAELPQADMETGGLAVWPSGIDPETGWCSNWESL